MRIRRENLSIRRILHWADCHHQRTGRWPSAHSGRIPEAPEETWNAVNIALGGGLRGLPGGLSVSRLLVKHRGSRAGAPPRLTTTQILAWADDHWSRTGCWPNRKSGPVGTGRGETWRGIDGALRRGMRGLRPGSSLAQLLDRRRHVRNRKDVPRLRVKDMLSWADAHYRRTGNWPSFRCGPVWDAPGETWNGIGCALCQGTRGLKGGDSLARFLGRHRGLRNPKDLPPLTTRQILGWADAHIRRHGRRPTAASGAIVECPGETWVALNKVLTLGGRGLPGGSSLARFLDRHGRIN